MLHALALPLWNPSGESEPRLTVEEPEIGSVPPPTNPIAGASSLHPSSSLDSAPSSFRQTSWVWSCLRIILQKLYQKCWTKAFNNYFWSCTSITLERAQPTSGAWQMFLEHLVSQQESKSRAVSIPFGSSNVLKVLIVGAHGGPMNTDGFVFLVCVLNHSVVSNSLLPHEL